MTEEFHLRSELFKISSNPINNAVVGYHKNWSTYAFGYWQAARHLSENAATIGMQDPFIYPIAFLYRHYLELQLKNIILLANSLINEGRNYPKKHELHIIWPMTKVLILKIWPYEPPMEFKIIEEIIDIFCEIDKSSFSFRYLINKKGKENLDGISHINIEVLSEAFEKIGWFLDGICDGISELLELKAEQSNCGD